MAGEATSHDDDGRAALRPSDRDVELERIRNSVRGIRFGEVRLIIQDGLIVQIERVEKQRLR
ncbi:YezD family protein [Tundrisphaera lichenicola]|uniref:YezD family protein n=1 Tax=Tundrisphaera lichenicola TaxID=2029860 RepID=UPI003EB8CE62